jgi:bifunctional non-homologous end joining protein LigD
MAAIFDGRGGIKLISRQGLDRTSTFRDVFHGFAASGPMILDGEIAAPDENGVTHIDGLHQAIAARRPDRLAYFAFDLIHLAGRDLRACGIEERKAVLRDAIGSAGCERVVYLDHVIGRGAELFDKVAALGGEGIVSKRLGRPYRGGETRDWLKTKVFEIGRFAVIGFQELGERRLEALYVAEERDGALCPAGQVRFGFAGRGLWAGLDGRRAGTAMKGIVPIEPFLAAEIKFFGRYTAGFIRDGVLLGVETDGIAAPTTAGPAGTWGCDNDRVIAVFDREEELLRSMLVR